MAVVFQDFVDLYTWDPVQAQWVINGLNIDNLSTEELEALAEHVRGYSLTTPQGQAFINTTYATVGGSPVPQVGSGTALELAQDAPLDATAEGLLSVGQGAMETGSGTGVYQTTSLLSLDVGVVGAAAAPILGVALGADFYQANPKFWTLLSQRLLPFCYPGTTEIPAWLDIVESALHPGEYVQNTVIDKRVLEAIKQAYIDAGYLITEVDSDVSTAPLAQPFSTIGNQGFSLAYQVPLYGGGYQDHLYEVTVNDPSIVSTILRISNAQGDGLYVYFSSPSKITNALTVVDSWVAQGTPHSTTYNYSTNGQWTHNNQVSWSGSFVVFTPGTQRTITALSAVTNAVSTVNGIDYTKVGWTMLYGNKEKTIPSGTDEWEGNEGSESAYSKPIVYMVEDPLNPGSFIPESQAGVAIAVPAPQHNVQPATVELTKPDDWPTGEAWPMTVPFPWSAPEGYEGEWPSTMPWPLPYQQPDWWPDVIAYPTTTITNPASVDPVTNPDPNVNTNPANPIPYLVTSTPGAAVSPAIQTIPQPVLDPTTVMQPINPVTTITDIMDPAIPIPEGITPLPIVPTVPLPFSTGNDGLISVYHPTDAQLKAFASWLWVTYADPSIQKLWNNPFDGVIGLMELYCTPTDIGTKTIRSGFLDSGVSSAIISRYTKIDCGSLTVPEYYGNYLDYSPYSKCHVYLPFIGIVELNVDDIVGHAVNITYVIDEYNGSCIAQITVAKSIEVGGEQVDYSNLMYQFSGNCAVELPLAGGTQAAIRAGLIQAAAYGLSSVIGGVVSGVSGNIGGAISQIGYGAANAIGSVVSAKSSVQHSGSFGSSFGAMGVKKPYITVTRPKQIDVVDYNKLYGYPAHAAVTVGSCTGYLRVREVNVASSTASDEEKKRIEELLKEGIYME